MKNKISVYAICKNESIFVDKWYESMKEADEIVVLDTGSTDDTIEKLKSHGIKVVQKIIDPWDFSVARNESFKLVSDDCNILVCTDLDEVFEPGWAKPLREKWIEGKHTRAQYKYVWSHTDSGQNGREFRYNKIHTKEWIWKYPVHELLCSTKTNSEHYPAEEELYLFDDITLHHYPDKTKSRSSYLGLLEKREAEYPDDTYGLIYLSHEYRYRGFLEKSNEKLKKTLDKFWDRINEVERASCFLFMGDNYTDLDRNNKAIECYLNAILVDPTYREPYINLAKVYIKEEEYELAIYYIKKGLKESFRHYTWLERDSSWTFEPYDLLSLAYYYNGDKLKSLGCAYKALEFNPDDQRLKNNVKIILENLKETDY